MQVSKLQIPSSLIYFNADKLILKKASIPHLFHKKIGLRTRENIYVALHSFLKNFSIHYKSNINV